jgi:hypothetical protein
MENEIRSALEKAYDQLPCTCGEDAVCDCAVAQVGAALSAVDKAKFGVRIVVKGEAVALSDSEVAAVLRAILYGKPELVGKDKERVHPIIDLLNDYLSV